MIYIGENQMAGVYLGDSEIFGVYCGELQLYPMGAFEGIKTSPKRLKYEINGGVLSLKVKSSELWAITDIPEWCEASQLSGGIGDTIISIIVGENDTEEDRDGTIVFTTENYTYSVPVIQYYIQYLSYIYCTGTGTAGMVNTPIYPSLTSKFRLEGAYTNRAVYDCIVGGDYSDDSNDYRLFFPYGGWMFDTSGNRREQGSTDSAATFDITAGNYYVYNNLTSKYWINASKYTSVNVKLPLRVNLLQAKIKTFQIWDDEDGNLVFSGRAAKKGDVVGLWDEVSGQMYTCSGTILYDE